MGLMIKALKKTPGGRFVLLGLVVCGVLAAIYGSRSYVRTREVETTVTGKDRVCPSNSGSLECKYLVFTLDGTFQLSDSLIAGRYDSSDLYGKIRPGQKYRLTVYGWRFGPSSMYPNIKKAEEID